ncbi:ectomycorrhiza-regulated protein [Moniliophthora roreri]|nr:ectomycorrhiza-regulated protein [Moniliophthora roreri]
MSSSTRRRKLSRIILLVIGGVCTIVAALAAFKSNSPGVTALSVVSGFVSVWTAISPFVKRLSIYRIVRRGTGYVGSRIITATVPRNDVELGVLHVSGTSHEHQSTYRPFRMKPRPKAEISLPKIAGSGVTIQERETGHIPPLQADPITVPPVPSLSVVHDLFSGDPEPGDFAQLSDDEDSDDRDELPPNATAQQRVEHLRRRNTLLARRSRKRRELYRQTLEETIDAMSLEQEKWKTRAETLRRIAEGHGFSVTFGEWSGEGESASRVSVSSIVLPDEEDEHIEELPPNASEEQRLEYRRLRNTLMARRSRRRKETYVQQLEEAVHRLTVVKERWKTQVETLERVIEGKSGLSDSPSDQSE